MEQATGSKTLVQFLQETARRFGHRPALLSKLGFRYRRWSYTQLWEEAGRAASLLQQRGLKKGDRALLWAPNFPQWVIAFFGCVRAGVIVVPLDLRSTTDLVQQVCSKTHPRLAFVSRLTPSGHEDLGLPEIYLEELEESAQGLPPPQGVDVASDDLVEIMFTSGTTGDPKGVMLSHRNLIANMEAASQHVPGKPSDRLMSILPLSHMFEQMGGLFMPLRCGANVTYPTSRQPTILFKTMRERKVTLLLLVPQALGLFMNGIEREVRRQGKERLWRWMMTIARCTPFRLRRLLFRRVHHRFGGSLELVFSGGAALDPELGTKWELLGIRIIQGYGATEASPVISCHTARRPRHDSAGIPLPGVDVEVSQDGEILVRGPNVTPGYWEAPEQTAAAFERGWYKTGDQGLFDKQGFLHIKGRKKDMIVLANGQNVFPEDIEPVLQKHPSIADAAVVGLPRGAEIEVHAVLLTDEPSAAPQTVSWANGQLAEHQRVRGFTIWPEEDLPKTHTLKVKKGVILDVLKGVAPGAATPPATADGGGEDESRGVRHLVAEVGGLPLEDVKAEMPLGGELNLDSLKRVELLSLIEEELGAYIDESLVVPETTLVELEGLVAQQAQVTAQLPNFYQWPLTGWCTALREVVHHALIFPWLSAKYRVRTTGLDNLDELQGPVLFAMNHNAIKHDSLMVLKVLPRKWRRRVAYAAAAEILFGNLWIGILSSLVANAFPLSRDTAIRPSLENLGSLLDRGWSVGIYPEGDQRVGEEMLPFQSGTGLLGVECRTPVVPVHLVSQGRPRRGPLRILRREPVSVRLGRPITFAPRTPYVEATSAIEEALKAL